MRESNEIRILVVEDTKEKLDGIISAMRQPNLFEGDVRLEIATADSFSSAQSKLAVGYFDVLILDLKIPIMPKGEPKLEYSRLLFEFVQNTAQSKPFYVLGLTSAPQDEVDKEFKESSIFSIQRYDAGNNWIDLLVERINFVVSAKVGLSQYLTNNFGLDVLIVTARKSNEFDPIVKAVSWLGDYHEPKKALGGIRNTFGYMALADGTEISLGVVCLDEMGLSHSAALTTNLVNMFRPRHLAMLGMCCGLKKILDPDVEVTGAECKLGDIIIARETCCWDEGKYKDDDPNLIDSAFFSSRAVDKFPEPSFWRKIDRFLDENDSALGKIVEAMYREHDLDFVRGELIGDVKFSPSASILWGTMVSGGCVIDSDKMISRIEDRFPRAIGLEMEAHSIYSAIDCGVGVQPNVLVIKGVADFGDGTKAKPVQSMASIGAFLVYKSILDEVFSSPIE